MASSQNYLDGQVVFICTSKQATQNLKKTKKKKKKTYFTVCSPLACPSGHCIHATTDVRGSWPLYWLQIQSNNCYLYGEGIIFTSRYWDVRIPLTGNVYAITQNHCGLTASWSSCEVRWGYSAATPVCSSHLSTALDETYVADQRNLDEQNLLFIALSLF